MGEEEDEDEMYFPWFKAMAMDFEEIEKELERLSKKFTKKILSVIQEEEEMERNDVYIYKTLRYPTKSTPPTPD